MKPNTIGLACLAAMTCVLGVPMPQAEAATVDGPKVTLNFNMYGTSRAASAGFEELSRLIGSATDGKFEIKIHWGAVLGPPKEALDGIQLGAYEMTFSCIAVTPGKLPTLEGLGLPFLPTPTIKHVRAMRVGYLTHPVPQADAARWNSKIIMPIVAAPQEFIGSGNPPKTTADFKGLRVRALSGDAAAMKLLGAVPQNIPSAEMYQAQERGLVSATGSAYSSLAAFKLHEVSTWYTKNLSISATPCFVFIGTKVFDGLPPQYRKLMMDSVPASLDHWEDAFVREDAAAEELFKKKGLVPVTFQEGELDRLRQQVRPIWDSWVEQMDKLGHNGKELLQLMIDSAKKVKMS